MRVLRLPSYVSMLLLVLLAMSVNAEPNDLRKRELINLVVQDCGSCHGMTLKGGLGPSLTPQSLQSKPRPAMVATIMYGRPGTPMPPWSNLLTEDEIRWIVDVLYKGVNNASP